MKKIKQGIGIVTRLRDVRRRRGLGALDDRFE